MKIKIIFLILMILFLNVELVSAEENEYGIVRAWFNEKNATLETIEGIKLKIGEPIEIKVEVISKINGDITLTLKEPGVTKVYDVLSGPSEEDEWLDNMKIMAGWSKTYTWTIAPNGEWKNGNAPINIFVQFNKGMKDKKIQFTIANPYILDEQYSGDVPIPKPTSTENVPSTSVKEAPFISIIFTIFVLVLSRRLMN